MFRLSCLCLTSVSPDLPDVVYGSVDSSKGACPLSEAFFPTQSYLSVVSGSSAICSSPSAIATFLTFEEQFGDAGFPDSFDPWTSVDFLDGGSCFRNSRLCTMGLVVDRVKFPLGEGKPLLFQVDPSQGLLLRSRDHQEDSFLVQLWLLLPIEKNVDLKPTECSFECSNYCILLICFVHYL